ncbi:hypothetical protein JTB14_037696 [Gonioctena quinquepunctata]|nr:hypothetical protein JTB14_037696 [Gonioctena quinquepunctata]
MLALDEDVLKNVETPIVKLYKVDPDVTCADYVCSILLRAVRRYGYDKPSLPLLEDCAWTIEQVVPRFMRRAQKLVFSTVTDFITQRNVVVGKQISLAQHFNVGTPCKRTCPNSGEIQ